jgi:polysaccharide biosynthesis protein PslH
MQDLLFLAQRFPYPPNKGDKIRSYHFLQSLAGKYRVHLGCFIDDPNDWQYLRTLSSMVASSCVLPLNRRAATLRSLSGLWSDEALSLPFYRDQRMSNWVADTVNRVRPQAAFVFSSQMAQYLLNGPRPRRFVMDFCDVDSQKWHLFAKCEQGIKRWLYEREARQLLAFEQRVAGVADASLFVSAAEARLFRQLSPEAERIHVLENGIDAAYFSPDRRYERQFEDHRPMAVFTGAMDYWPNIEAMTWFVGQVLPLIRRQLPLLRLTIVGSNPTPEVKALAATRGVIVTGRVPDVRPYLAHAAVVIAPMQTARGVQNKVLEGLAMARPMVATGPAHDGLNVEAGTHLLVADSPQDFADGVVQVIENPEWAVKAQAARRRVIEAYDWRNRFAELHALLTAETVAEAAD